MLRAVLATFLLPNQFGTKGFKPKTARWAIFGAEKAEKPGVEDASRRASRDAAVFRVGIASYFVTKIRPLSLELPNDYLACFLSFFSQKSVRKQPYKKRDIAFCPAFSMRLFTVKYIKKQTGGSRGFLPRFWCSGNQDSSCSS